MRPWYFRWWGIAILAYIAVSAVLGIAFLVSSRRAAPRAPSPLDGFRTGGFTASGATGSTFDPTVPLFDADDPALGAPVERAQLVIVEFSDFQCPFCRQAFPVIREAVAAFGDRGLRYVYRDFPVEELHADAQVAAEAAQCAHAQGKFWAYHDKLFQNTDAQCPSGASCGGGLDAASLARYADQVGIDRVQFEMCVASHRFQQEVKEDHAAGLRLGVAGTPTWFFVPVGDSRQARRVEGVIPREALVKFLDRTLTPVTGG